eukprot:1486486-Amphidinium_carterae.1
MSCCVFPSRASQDMLLVAAVTGGGELTSSKPEATQALSLASEEIAELLQANAIFWRRPQSKTERAD